MVPGKVHMCGMVRESRSEEEEEKEESGASHSLLGKRGERDALGGDGGGPKE